MTMRWLLLVASFCSLVFAVDAAFSHEWRGKASYYTLRGKTASGAVVSSMTAAHKTLPFGSRIRVVNLANHKSVVVTVRDRGPFVAGRVVDVTKDAAEALGFVAHGVAEVSVATIN